MPKRLHYLRLADYGKDSIAASTAIVDNDPSIATRVVSVGVHTPSCTFIADFCIDLAHPIRVIGSTSHSRSLHAEFIVLEDDPTAHRWPHWMQHTLWEHLIDVRGKLSEALTLRVFARAMIATYVDGAGSDHVIRGIRRRGRPCRS